MIRNPELLRNLWIELTLHRLISTPIICGLLFYISYYFSGFQGLFSVATLLFIFFCYIWGGRNASDAVCSEINAQTWDWQRMSQLSPMTMAVGKLIGSTSYTWFGASIAFSAYLWAGTHLGIHALQYKSLTLLTGGLFIHSLALLFSLEGLNYTRHDKVKSFKYFVCALLVGGIFSYIAYNSFDLVLLEHPVEWFHYSFNRSLFLLSSLTLFLAWSIIGLYRNFRIELQYKNIPWVWALFTLFLMVYLSGFVQTEPFNFKQGTLIKIKELIHQAPLYVALLTAITLTYISFLSENITALRYKRWLSATKERGVFFGLQRLPRWPASFILACLASIFFATKQSIAFEFKHLNITYNPLVASSSIMLFLLRDLALSHVFHLKQNKSATLTTLLYLGVLYALIPVFLNTFQLTQLTACFIPSFGQYPVASTLGPLLQFAAVALLLRKRWNNLSA